MAHETEIDDPTVQALDEQFHYRVVRCGSSHDGDLFVSLHADDPPKKYFEGWCSVDDELSLVTWDDDDMFATFEWNQQRPFDECVSNLVDGEYNVHSNVIHPTRADIELAAQSTVIGAFPALDDDAGVEINYVEFRHTKSKPLRIGLKDVRDE